MSGLVAVAERRSWAPRLPGALGTQLGLRGGFTSGVVLPLGATVATREPDARAASVAS